MDEKNEHGEAIDTDRCCFCHKTIEWQDGWCEHGGTVPAEVAHVTCCPICSEEDEDVAA
jgi:hypothetical protein